MRPAATIAILFTLVISVSSTLVYGSVYEWSTLDKLSKTIVTVNTTPKQVKVADDGSYSFQLPNGVFEITAEYSKGNETLYSASEVVSVNGTGEYVLDLILFPNEDVFPETIVEVPELNVTNGLEKQPPAVPLESILIGILVVALVIPFAMWVFLKRKKLGRGLEVSVKKVLELPKQGISKDQQELLDKIRQAGGSIGQKELRHTLHVSEAKASMLVSELEAQGLVKRIKKGRGNLVKITG